MKTPPLLLGAVLAFWGWQSGFLITGVLMGLALEGARLVRTRWEFTDEDFSRIWTFSYLTFLAAGVYAFAANEGPSDFRGFFHNPNFTTQHNAGVATLRTTSALLRWLPMIFFLFAAAQVYGSRDIPLHIISLTILHRRKSARKLGLPFPSARSINISYSYFALCLFSASRHAAEDASFFWGFCVLMAWALWPNRSRRYGLVPWVVALGIVIILSFYGQKGIGQLQGYLGNLNPQWLSGFSRRRFDPIQSQTEIGNLGRIKTSSKIVIRLEAKNGVPPRRLRETSYRSFKGRTWYAELTENDFSRVTETNETCFSLVEKPTTDTVNIACYLPGGKALLPLPRGCARLEHLLAYNVWKSPLGAVLEEGPGLVVFDALYGPGSTIDSPADDDIDLSLPLHERPALEQVATELHLQGQDLDRALETLAHFFSGQFTYSTWFSQSKFARKNETPLTRFLLRTRTGHCEYFATAAVLLLREIHIPARYAVGFAVHEGSGQNYVVRQSDAHAWCLAWDARRNAWREFDPTPGSWIAMDAQKPSLLQRLSDIFARVTFEISKFRWGQSHLRQYLLWTLLPILGLLLYQIVFRRRYRRWAEKRSKLAHAPDWPGLDSELYLLEKKLALRGVARQPSEPLSDWLRRVAADASLAELNVPLRELLSLHYRYRFDPHGLASVERERLREVAHNCLLRIDQRAELTATE